MRTSLSKGEFASALGMKADAVFVKKMFNIVDKDSDGRISFQVRILLSFAIFFFHYVTVVITMLILAGVSGYSGTLFPWCY